MKKIFSSLFSLTFSFIIFIASAQQIMAMAAFPGAEGFGSQTVGGRGGRVYIVTNTNDSGPGSFREAATAKDHRIIIFTVGGLINLQTPIEIDYPYVTIAGQTAPGDGITFAGSSLSLDSHDIIVRGMRCRAGDGTGEALEFRDCIRVGHYTSQTYNIIVDHNSLALATDENASNWYAQHDMTWSWNIISEAIHLTSLDSGYCLLIGEHSQNISAHHNLCASNKDRNPRITGDTTTEFINNIVYNWATGQTTLSGGGAATIPLKANIIGNYYKETAGSNSKYGINILCTIPIGSLVYVKDNYGYGLVPGDDWSVVQFQSGCNTNIQTVKSLVPAFVGSGITATDAQTAYNTVLQNAGAPKRDAIDVRDINSVMNGTQPVTGAWQISSMTQAGGWPVYKPGSPPPDSDNDGLPDNWDAPARNPSDIALSGYTWIEEYLNSFYGTSTTPSPTPLPWTSLEGDYTTWYSHYLTSVTGFSNGDYNQNGLVDGIDYVLWLTYYGK